MSQNNTLQYSKTVSDIRADQALGNKLAEYATMVLNLGQKAEELEKDKAALAGLLKTAQEKIQAQEKEILALKTAAAPAEQPAQELAEPQKQ